MRRTDMRPAVFVALTVAALPVVVSACGDAVGPSERHLTDKTFVLTDVVSDEHTLVRGVDPRLTFTDRTVEARPGCNTFSGPMSIEGSVLVVRDLAGTDMGCDPALMDQDGWFAAFLASRPSFELESETLTLASDDMTLRFVEETLHDTALEGTEWHLESLHDGSDPHGTVASVPAGVRAGLLIEDGQILVRSGCNDATGPVTVTTEQFTAGRLTWNLKDCDGVRADIEERFRRVLQQPTSYAVDGATLTLWAADGDTGLGFRAPQSQHHGSGGWGGAG